MHTGFHAGFHTAITLTIHNMDDDNLVYEAAADIITQELGLTGKKPRFFKALEDFTESMEFEVEHYCCDMEYGKYTVCIMLSAPNEEEFEKACAQARGLLPDEKYC